MKKQALLAVSALSLGVVGLATFTPVVSATDSATSEQTINLTVNGTLGIGANNDGTGTMGAVTTSMNANATTSKKSDAIYYVNNTGASATITLADKDTTTDLTGTSNSSNKIATGTSIAKGTSAWGVKGGDVTSYSAMPASTGTALTLHSGTDTSGSITDVEYGFSTSATQAADTYTDTVVYTISQS